MSDDTPRTYVAILGVGPDDFEWDDETDEARDLADDIHDLVREDYSENVTGTVVVVDPQLHDDFKAVDRGDC